MTERKEIKEEARLIESAPLKKKKNAKADKERRMRMKEARALILQSQREIGLPYDAVVATAICEMIVEGASLKQISAQPGMPKMATIFRWLSIYPEFEEMYHRARDLQTEAMSEEIIEISDDTSNDVIEIEKNGKIVEMTNHEHINRSKLKVETRKWLMTRRAPKRFGDKGVFSGEAGNGIRAVLVIEG